MRARKESQTTLMVELLQSLAKDVMATGAKLHVGLHAIFLYAVDRETEEYLSVNQAMNHRRLPQCPLSAAANWNYSGAIVS